MLGYSWSMTITAPTLNDHRPSRQLQIELADARDRLVQHPLYRLVNTPDRLRRFMETHVWAVWDFQSLLKAMQQRLSCTTVPWLPTADPEARRLVNEIVLDEESDELPDGGYASHFELYLEAMETAAANTHPIRTAIDLLRGDVPLSTALDRSAPPAEARRFVDRSFGVITSGSTLAIVAAFTYGREDVIPDMFRHLVAGLAESEPARWSRVRY
jgi:hypothetical protein